MIKINKYDFGLGNQLFQYCWGRYISEKKGYKFVPIPIKFFPETHKIIDGIEKNDNLYETPIATQIFDTDKIINHDGFVLICGYPQRYEHYINNKENIKKWLYIENEEFYDKPNVDDLVIHIRLGDYVSLGWDLDVEYYIKILEKETFNNAIIVCNYINHDKIKKLKEIGCIIKDNSKYNELEYIADFVFLKHAKKTIISNSTFSWWATFLGEGKVYFPCIRYPWIGNPENHDIDLRVYDENRYTFIY